MANETALKTSAPNKLAEYKVTVWIDAEIWKTLDDEKLNKYDDAVLNYIHELQTKLGNGFVVGVEG